MGGRGSGGHPSTGPKPADQWVDEGEFPAVHAPEDLSIEARAVWERLSPRARERRTLTTATAEDFGQLCKAIVFADKLEAKVVAEDFETTKVTLQMDAAGGGLQNVEKKKHHLLSELRGWRQFISGRLASFRLSAMGKPVAPAATKEKPQSALEALQAQRPAIRAVK